MFFSYFLVHAPLLILKLYAAKVLVLWQTAPALIIFGFLVSYRTARCLLLTVLVPVLNRSVQNLGRCCRPVVRASIFPSDCLAFVLDCLVWVFDQPVLPARGEELGSYLPQRPPSYPVYVYVDSGAYVCRVQLG